MTNRKRTPQYNQARKQLLAHNPPCHWCGGIATEADHLIEHDAGGNDSIDNLVPSCKPCNARRGQKYKETRDAQRQKNREQAFFGREANTPTPVHAISLPYGRFRATYGR
jgi:5-methylcytosine-specific restriction endonuclease McrA